MSEGSSGIFISYRREDSEGEAGRLFDDLERSFGEKSVFLDVVGIQFGRDFRKIIDQNVTACGALLAIIGPRWALIEDANGAKRLDNPNDYVRLEIATALARDIPVIPVLVREAKMPHIDQLPPDLRDLAYRHCVELSHSRWHSDVALLTSALKQTVFGPETGESQARQADREQQQQSARQAEELRLQQEALKEAERKRREDEAARIAEQQRKAQQAAEAKARPPVPPPASAPYVPPPPLPPPRVAPPPPAIPAPPKPWSQGRKAATIFGAIGFALIVFMLAVHFATTDNASAQPDTPAAAPQPQPYVSTSGRFSVLFPGPPKQSTDQISLDENGSATLFQFVFADDKLVYTVMYNDYPKKLVSDVAPQTILQGARDGATEKDTLTNDHVIELNGVPGRAYTLTDKDGSTVVIRDFFDGQRLYQVMVAVGPGTSSNPADDFLNSFRILPGS
jgi:hypothetical protein